MANYNHYVRECEQANTSLLGNLVMVQVSDQTVSRSKLLDALALRKLSTTKVPPPTRTIDAWKKGCSKIDGSRYHNSDGTKNTYLVRELDNQTRAVMQETTDSENRRLSYRPVATVTISEFERGEDRYWDWANRTPDGFPVSLEIQEQEQVEDLRVMFEKVVSSTYNTLDGSRVRRLVMATLAGNDGFEVRPSVWFLPNKHSEMLANFTEALHEVTQAVKLILVPLIDLDSQRDMVVEAYKNESAQAMQVLLREALNLIDQVKSGKSVRAKTVQTLVEDYNQQVAKASVYANEFTTSVDHLKENAALTKDALAKLKEII